MSLPLEAPMPVQITVRDVPEAVRDRLAAKAAREGRSMQEYLKAELTRLAGKPTRGEWIEAVRRRKQATGVDVPLESILEVIRDVREDGE